MNEVMYGASIATARSRFVGARTVNPWPWSSDATAFQLDASAQAPWTRTMVGFGIWCLLQVAGFGSAGRPYRRPSSLRAPPFTPSRRPPRDDRATTRLRMVVRPPPDEQPPTVNPVTQRTSHAFAPRPRAVADDQQSTQGPRRRRRRTGRARPRRRGRRQPADDPVAGRLVAGGRGPRPGHDLLHGLAHPPGDLRRRHAH